MPRNFDLLPYPEDSISLDIDKDFDSLDLVIEALNLSIENREMKNKIKIKKFFNSRRNLNLYLNKFFTQIAICSFFDNEVTLSSNQWIKNNKLPQLILAAKVDDENNIVNFAGVMTGNEIRNFIDFKNIKKKSICIPLEYFQGDIDLLLNYVDLLNYNSIPTKVFQNKFSLKEYLFIRNSKIKLSGSLIFATFLAFIFGPRILEPKLLSTISNLEGTNLLIANTQRTEENDVLKVCILSPNIINQNINYITVDKPVLIFKEKLNEIKLLKDNIIIWEKKATLENRINTPINWPVEPIQKNHIYTLKIRPINSSLNSFKDIYLKANNNLFDEINILEKKLGKNKSKWIRKINKNINNNPNLSMALLFSEKRPKSEIMDNAQQVLINKSKCLN